VGAVSFIVLWAAQIGRKVPPFMRVRARKEGSLHFGREVGDDPGQRQAHPSMKGGSGAHALVAEWVGAHAWLHPLLGQPKRRLTASRKEGQGG
jgi:hypothetical protein